jgi:hypothetical protein
MKRGKGVAGEFGASTVVLVITNLIPLFGVLAWNWSAFNVVALYWIENLIIGVINVLKMLTCNPDPEQIAGVGTLRSRIDEYRTGAISSGRSGNDEQLERQLQQMEKLVGKTGCAHHGIKVFMIPFFVVHYGLFCAVHGVFIMVLLGGDKPMSGKISGSPLEGGATLAGKVFENGGIWFVLALAVSHLFSFFVNYLAKGENRRTTVPALMAAPYARIVVMHLTILFGAFAVMAFGSPVFLVLLLIVGKTIVDLGFHLRSHRKLERDGEDTSAKAAL